MATIKFQIGSINLLVETLDTPTAKAILDQLPFTSTARTWGKEVYFPVPVQAELESGAKDVIEAGEIAFWVQGQCIAIGFGPTPISKADEIRLADKTNIWAKALDNVDILKSVKDGDSILVSIEEV